MKKKPLKLTEQDKEFVKDFSRKIILRAYLRNSANRPRTLSDKFKGMFIRKHCKAPLINILDLVERQHKG